MNVIPFVSKNAQEIIDEYKADRGQVDVNAWVHKLNPRGWLRVVK